MQGIVLGYNSKLDEGVITANDRRYKFKKSHWKEIKVPQKGAEVDFVPRDGMADEIYLLANAKDDKMLTILGFISLFITLFLGFIGTALSRMLIAKQSFHQSIGAIAIHAVITIIGMVVPMYGPLIYLIVTVYFMVQNYKLIVKQDSFTPDGSK